MLRTILAGLFLVAVMGCGAAKSPQTSTSPFVGSAGRAAFHRTSCQWAKRIKPENRMEYAAREEALDAGLESCKVCRP